MTILHTIAEVKKQEVASLKATHSLSSLKKEAANCPPTRHFIEPFRTPSNAINIIAEVKKASPSLGVIRADFDPVQIARSYENGGARALSVLTDQPHFQGELRYLKEIREAVALPLLRKDFIIDAHQIYESRIAGADAILLIAALLDAAQIADYTALANDLHMGVLIEVHDEEELEKILPTRGDYLIGVNNRDLKTFEVALKTSEKLATLLPKDNRHPLISESGLKTREDLLHLKTLGYRGFLIGETFMRTPDPGHSLRELIGI